MIPAHPASRSGGLANHKEKNETAHSHPSQVRQPVCTSKAIWTRGILLHNRTLGSEGPVPDPALPSASCVFLPGPHRTSESEF